MKRILVCRYVGPGNLDSAQKDEVKDSIRKLLDEDREVGIIVMSGSDWGFEMLDLEHGRQAEVW